MLRHTKRCAFLSCLAFLAAVVSPAQPGLVVTGGGNALPVVPPVAPGQVTTFFVAGAPVSAPAAAGSASLPTSLAGISVTIRQSRGTSPVLNAPLFAVWPVPTCEPGLAFPCNGDTLTAVTLQIPFELFPNAPGDSIFGGSEAVLTVAQDGRTSGEFRVRPVVDQVHVLNSCDDALPFDFRGDPACRPVVVHANGALVTESDPAAPGETLVLYAFGLGAAGLDAATGQPAPAPALDNPVAARVRLRFDFALNASPNRVVDPEAADARPLFSGLVQGFVGLYQVNFRVPDAPADLEPCIGAVRSNLTVGVSGAASFDGAALCVRP